MWDNMSRCFSRMSRSINHAQISTHRNMNSSQTSKRRDMSNISLPNIVGIKASGINPHSCRNVVSKSTCGTGRNNISGFLSPCLDNWNLFISSILSLSHVGLFETPWIAAHQASLSITNSRNLPKLISIESVMPSNHLILSSPSPPAFNLSQPQSLFKWVNSSHQVAKVLHFQPQHQSL